MNSACVAARLRSALWACARLLSLCLILLLQPAVGRALAHEGHDHGEKRDATTRSAQSPRVTAVSERYQIVGIVEGEVLVVFLDRADSNEPVTSAELYVGLDAGSYKAELQRNGTYEVTAAALRSPGSVAVVFTVNDADTSDLLAADLVIPNREASATADPASRMGRSLGLFGAGAILALGAGLFVVTRLRSCLRNAAVGSLAFLFLLHPASKSLAHDGHDHGPDVSAAQGNTPARRTDGSIFLPKPTQRLLDVRTRVVRVGTSRRVVKFSGRVVANPNFSGVVQSTIQGRYHAPPAGVPAIGTRVKSGDLLGTVSPSFTSVDSSDMAQTLGDLEQKISIARAKLARQEQLLRTNVVATAIVDEARLELEGLQRRRTELVAARVRPEELRAPVDGVIAFTRVVSGQVVAQADRMFELVEPSKLLVEALAFEDVAIDEAHAATGIGRAGARIHLLFLGRSRALQQHYSLIQFDVLETSVPLDVGTPMGVQVEVGPAIEGLFVPKAALAQAPNGQSIVFEHKEPEVFVPRAVRFEPVDNETVRITGGLAAGAKIVVRNASLVKQVR